MSVEDRAGFGAVSRAKASIAALEVLAEIRAGARQYATDEERRVLAGWSGWGPLKDMFKPPTETWSRLHAKASELLPVDDLQEGFKGTYNAFFTPTDVTAAMWELLYGLGFNGGHVAELGCGAGAFMGTAPDGVRVTGVERDRTSAAIAALLHPEHEVINRALQDVQLPSSYAAVIGNVPFGDVSIYDPLAPKGDITRSLHNYFIWRAVRAVAPGGMVVLLTSRYTLDAADDGAREQIGHLADFVGAVRLPAGGLQGGTEAVADVVVLRRKVPGEKSTGHDWLPVDRERFGYKQPVSSYFVSERPGMVLGELAAGETTQYGLGVTVKPIAGETAGDGIRRVARDLVVEATVAGLRCRPPADAAAFDVSSYNVVSDEGWLENSYHQRNGQLLVVKEGRALPLPRPGAELLALVKLRDLAEALIAAEADYALPDAKIEPLRKDTAAAYRRYVGKYGPLRRSKVFSKGVDAETGIEEFGRRVPPMGGFRHDPGSALVFALEVFDDETGVGEPAPILSTRQNRPVVLPTSTTDPGQALAWSMDRRGDVDVDYIAGLLGVDVEQVPDLLGDLVFTEPGYDRLLTAEQYLTGDVRAKLRAAETAAIVDPRFQRNVAALRKALPKWLGPGEIVAALGTPWIGAADVEAFIRELMGYGGGAKVRHLRDCNRWEVEPGGSRNSTAASETWGTQDVDFYKLVELALNGKAPEVRVRVSKTATKKSEELSLQASEVQQRIKERFSAWVWENAERCERLVAHYNNHFNCLVTRRFNGDHITVAGLAPHWADKLYPHQREYIARVVATPASLCGHPVGAGKTATMTCAAMKLRELRLVDKPMLVVPNHLIEQADAAARQMFPAAKILSASAETVRANRRAFTARVATQQWDLIIITHSAFDRMPVHSSTELAYLQDAQAKLKASLLEADPDGDSKGRMLKMMGRKLDDMDADIEKLLADIYNESKRQQQGEQQAKGVAKKLDRMDAKVRGLQNRKHGPDGGVTFEQLGVRWVGIDEAHNYKNLSVPCMNEGFTISPSKRATHLDMILRWLSTQSSRYAGLFTGTPVSNTMLELYVMMQYLMPEYLADIGLPSADSWTAAYVEMVTKVGVTVNGGSFELQTRPARFINAPELRVLFSVVADIRTADDLGLPRPNMIEEAVKVQPTRAQAAYSEVLVSRAKALKGVRFPEKGADNMLKVCNDGRWMATDPALVGIVDSEPGKLHAIAENVARIWREYPDEIQLVFCDVGTPSDAKGTQTYGRLRKLMVDLGMPVHQIEFAHSAKSDADKAAQFKRAREGKLKVLIGSTGKMGTGTNVQDRVKAMHHADAPFTPASVEQRDGRGNRPGNRNGDVFNFRYVTARTFDAYLWQMLVRKLTFISQLMTGKLDRSVEDCATDQLLSFSAVQASATDQPLLMEREDIAAEVNRLRIMQGAHRQQQQRQRHQIPLLKDAIEKKLAEMRAYAAVAAAQVPPMTEDIAEELHAAMNDFRYRTTPVVVGGVTVTFGHWITSVSEQREPQMRVDGGAGWVSQNIYQNYKAGTVGEYFMKLLAQAEVAEPVLADVVDGLRRELAEKEALLGQPFDKQDELTAALARLDQIEAALKREVVRSEMGDADSVVTGGAVEEQLHEMLFMRDETGESDELGIGTCVNCGWNTGSTLTSEADVEKRYAEHVARERLRAELESGAMVDLGGGRLVRDRIDDVTVPEVVRAAERIVTEVAEAAPADPFAAFAALATTVEPEPTPDPLAVMDSVFGRMMAEHEQALADKMAAALASIGVSV